MNGQQINIFECLDIKDTFRIVLFEDLRSTVSMLPDSPHKHMKYKHYIDLIYKAAFNKTAKQIKMEYKIQKQMSLTSLFTLSQKSRLKEIELHICCLLNEGFEYSEIKEVITDKHGNANIQLKLSK